MNTWQPIETAPRDRSKFIAAYIKDNEVKVCGIARCINGIVYPDYCLGVDGTATCATHWMPLPEVKE